MKLFRRKPIDTILKEGGDGEHSSGLNKVLTVKDLTFFGIAAILGAGSFSSLGSAVFNGGPGVIFLFVIVAIACAFTAFCYSEFASRIPVAGSAYTYAYSSFGELFAWIIGWALIMEYSIGNIYVAYSWSDYFTSLLGQCGVQLPEYLCTSYMEASKAFKGNVQGEALTAWNTATAIGGLKIILDLPAIIINLVITYLVYKGVKESKNFSNLMVWIKMFVVGLIIIVGGFLIFKNDLFGNWTPNNSVGIPSFMPNGFSGVMMAVSGVFFAYIGFDAVSVMAEESKNPQRDLPRGMIYSLVICTVVYILLTLVLTGAANYKAFEGIGDPLAFIFEKENLNLPWMHFLVAICAVVAMTSVMLVFQMGQPRIWMTMSRDGLMPKRFSNIHPKYKTPSYSTLITGLVVGVPLLFTDKTFVLDFTSIGTLFAFVLVCGGVLLIPRREKEVGKFHLPYINAKFVLPFMLVISLVFAFSKYNKETVDFVTNEKQLNSPEKILKSLDKTETKALEAFLNVTKDKNLESVLNTSFTKDEKTYQSFVDRLPILENQKYTLGLDLFLENIPFWVFYILCIVMSFLAFFKDLSLIPLLGLISCCYLLTGMAVSNWMWFGVWLVIGLVIYFSFSYKNSRLNIEPAE